FTRAAVASRDQDAPKSRCAVVQDPLLAYERLLPRWLSLHVLRSFGPGERTYARPCPTSFARRTYRVEQHFDRLHRLQCEQGQPNARAGGHAACAAAARAKDVASQAIAVEYGDHPPGVARLLRERRRCPAGSRTQQGRGSVGASDLLCRTVTSRRAALERASSPLLSCRFTHSDTFFTTGRRVAM